MGLAFNKALVAKLEAVSAAPEIVQLGLIAGHLALPVVLELSGLSQENAESLASLFQKLPMGLNKQREILQNLKEIAIREDRTLKGLIEEAPLTDILNDKGLDGNQKVHRVRAYLKKRRYPRLVAVEDNFNARVRSLGLSGEIQVSPPPGFEGSTCTMTIRVNNLDSLKCASRKISQAIENRSITKLFE